MPPTAAEHPSLPPGALPLLVMSIAALWLWARVSLLRRRRARRLPGEPPPRAWKWLSRLADARQTGPVLAIFGAALALALLLVFYFAAGGEPPR